MAALPPALQHGLCARAPHQVLHHGLNLLLGHAHVLCGAFQSDLVLALCELDVNLPQQSKGLWGQAQQQPLRPTGFPREVADPRSSCECTSTARRATEGPKDNSVTLVLNAVV